MMISGEKNNDTSENKSTKQVSILKFLLGALVAVIASNLIFRIVFKLVGGSLNVAIGVCVAGFVALWFLKSVGRAPTFQERSRFLWLYAGTIAFLSISEAFWASLNATTNINTFGLVVGLAYYLPYPLFAAMLFSEKHFSRMLPK
jgi:hypothetical protein